MVLIGAAVLAAVIPAIISANDHFLLTVNRHKDHSADIGTPSFVAFLQQHGRSYKEGTAEYEHRRNLYETRIKSVQMQNSKPARLWTGGINHLSDWSETEFAQLLGLRPVVNKAKGLSPHATPLALLSSKVVTIPENHMWNASSLSRIPDQGQCGSCWAVATASMSEANYEITTHKQRSFSAQELVNCVPNPHECGGQGGCQGATVELAMVQMMQMGLATENEVPYRGANGVCVHPASVLQISGADKDRILTFDEIRSVGMKKAEGAGAESIKLFGWQKLPVNKGAPLREALVQGTVALSVDGQPWSAYSSGIFDGCSKDATINHAVVAVGFGVESGNRYWKIQNSWGNLWGEGGHIRLLDTDDNFCGTDSHPEEGVACKGDPTSVRVCGMCGMFFDNVQALFGDQNSM